VLSFPVYADENKELENTQDSGTADSGGSKNAISALYETQEILKGVLQMLVEQKTLTQEQADQIQEQAAQQAQQRLEQASEGREIVIEEPPPGPTEKVIRVPYMPEYVKQQMRDEIANGLREDTVDAVLGQARQERWGMPGVTPEWVDRIKWKGDFRLRAQVDRFDDQNSIFFYDFQKINEEGGRAAAGTEVFLNTTEDRERLRVRARLAMDAKITSGVKAGFRISTGNENDPVSTNQTLGNSFNKYSIVFDRVYIKYDDVDADSYPYLTLLGGRMPNPWLSTDLVWDSDVAFDGVAGTYRMNLRGSDSLMDMTEDDRTLMITVGAFPLQEVELSDDDKWLFGAQLQFEFVSESQSIFNVGLAYYDYENIQGQVNNVPFDDTLDYTAPQFMQKGNTIFDIRTDPNGIQELYGLASDYDLVSFTVNYDIANFAPYHIVLKGDYVKNIGYDKAKIEERLQGRSPADQFLGDPSKDRLEEKTTGFSAKVKFGWPKVTFPGNWDVSIAYKYLERDAVLDAFTDSDFHLGGTNAKGYIVGAQYGLMENTWLSFRYLSSDEIDGPPLGIDTYQLDINGKF
jgi:hypothetical protein